MNKRKMKKKFKLTNEEFQEITYRDPNILKYFSSSPYGFFLSSSLDCGIYFWKGKRVSKDYYEKMMNQIE